MRLPAKPWVIGSTHISGLAAMCIMCYIYIHTRLRQYVVLHAEQCNIAALSCASQVFTNRLETSDATIVRLLYVKYTRKPITCQSSFTCLKESLSLPSVHICSDTQFMCLSMCLCVCYLQSRAQPIHSGSYQTFACVVCFVYNTCACF